MPNRVLVVDDNQDAAEVLELGLTNIGYVVRTASDARSALAVADEFQPDIALLDIGLPDMDGYDLGSRLRDSHEGYSSSRSRNMHARPTKSVRQRSAFGLIF